MEGESVITLPLWPLRYILKAAAYPNSATLAGCLVGLWIFCIYIGVTFYDIKWVYSRALGCWQQVNVSIISKSWDQPSWKKLNGYTACFNIVDTLM